MRITRRLTIMLCIAMLATLCVGGLGVLQLHNAQQRFDYVSSNAIPSIRDLNATQRAVSEMRTGVYKSVIATTPAQAAAAQEVLDKADRRFDALMAEYLANDISDDTDRQMLETDKAAMADYRAMRNKALDLIKAGQHDQAVATLFGLGMQVAQRMVQSVDQHMAYNFTLTGKLIEENQAAYRNAVIVSVSIIAVAFLLSAYFGIQLYRIISTGLTQIQGTMEQVSESLDFTHRAPEGRQDEIGLTATAFNRLLNRLQDNLKSILGGAHQVGQASEQMAQTAGEVSSAAAQQSEAAANMAATVEQLTVSINHVAEQAESARQLAQEAGTLAGEGSTIIGQTIRDIHEISESVKTSASSIRELETYSGEVSRVVSMIRDIADQTNLLALNAAIEAARAGEQGRGFAVVADEVRKLAERTARSTQEITGTIDTMVSLSQQATSQMRNAEERVETGVARADEADTAIKRIGDTSGRTAGMVNEISAAITEQGVASNNIAAQVERTAQMAEQSSAAAGETASNAQRLDQLARGQIDTLSRYRL